MLDESLVFHKSGSGIQEVANPSRRLSPKLRRALILVDGEKTVADLATAFRPGEVDAILRDLHAQGFVALQGGAPVPGNARMAGPAPDPAGPSSAAPGFEEVRRRAMREISHRLGPNGDSLALKVERCKTPEELRMALREAEKILASYLGAEYGRTFAQTIGRDLT